MFEIGRAGALFADDMEVQKKLRDFYNGVTAQSKLQAEIAARQAAGKPDPQDGGRMEASARDTTGLLVAVIQRS